LNQGGAVVDMQGLNNIIHFDEGTGAVRAESGVTVRQLWQRGIAAGWWPPIVPGTMDVTLGGAVAMNIHGKNHFQAGSFGDHLRSLTLVMPDQSTEVLTPETHPERFTATVGAQGLNGTILELTMQMKRVHSGLVDVEAAPAQDLAHALQALDAGASESAYSVGWLDCFAGGKALGRGTLHFARHIAQDHPLAAAGLSPDDQALPERIFGALPRRHAWRILRLLTNDTGMRFVNAGKYWGGAMSPRKRYYQSHAAFHFLLDYMPEWKNIYRPHGVLQYQFFTPKDAALAAFTRALQRQHELGVISYLAVVKRHREDRFAGGYSADGYSLALDFPIRPARFGDLRRLLRDFDAIQAETGGRIYAAKDAVSCGQLPALRDPHYSNNLARRWDCGRQGLHSSRAGSATRGESSPAATSTP
jgi:FAD/FMN-containing dehydrogenase